MGEGGGRGWWLVPRRRMDETKTSHQQPPLTHTPPPPPHALAQTTIRIVTIRLLYSFTIISLMPTNFVGYLEARYGLKSHEVRTYGWKTVTHVSVYVCAVG